MSKVVVEIEWDAQLGESFINADNVAIALHAYCKNDKFIVREPAGLSASEAIYGFAGWLTKRSERIVMSSKDDAGAVVDLVVEFCEVNQLASPREGWANGLLHPMEEK